MHGLHDRDRLQEVIIELLAVCNVTAIGCYPVCIICAVCCVVVIVYTVYVVIVMSVGIVGVDTVGGSDTVTWIVAADIMGILLWWESGGYIIILLPLELLLLFIIISYLRILAYYLLLLLFPLSLGLVALQCRLVRNCTIYIYLLIAAHCLITIADSIVDTVVADTVVAALLGLGCLYAEILDIEL